MQRKKCIFELSRQFCTIKRIIKGCVNASLFIL
nr:MAG TPA: hypothetical protein [Caudoviricetes sp.]